MVSEKQSFLKLTLPLMMCPFVVSDFMSVRDIRLIGLPMFTRLIRKALKGMILL